MKTLTLSIAAILAFGSFAPAQDLLNRVRQLEEQNAKRDQAVSDLQESVAEVRAAVAMMVLDKPHKHKVIKPKAKVVRRSVAPQPSAPVRRMRRQQTFSAPAFRPMMFGTRFGGGCGPGG